MALGVLAPFVPQQYLDATGKPYAGGKLYTYQAGTVTPLPTYTDSALLVPQTNPIILDSAGRATFWLTSLLAYKFVLTDAAGVPVATTANVIAGHARLTAVAGDLLFPP